MNHETNIADTVLDLTDLQLLDLLQRDAGLSNLKLAELLHISPPTCLRRVRRLHTLGLIERQVAIARPEMLAPLVGHGLQALVEVTLERQNAEALETFEAAAVAEDGVQQCWRVSPGPDFMLVIACKDMPAYLALSQRLFTAQANVRNVKTFFATKRAKFSPHLPRLAPLPHTP
ncbi:MAG TPA: Lrp/AsnC family transcriptional regulator [Comamonas sp.]|uniref:Lrp/AsnC family transcriptional regulator n=1 Tax=Comamonas halotolerans TaxID=3041496 RepID=UPI0024E155DB|nr:Lrp/AsnC family transcriptional regulator [Comamonas sp. NoAH]